MAMSPRVHAKRLSPTHVRELGAAYDKGGISCWDHSPKPKGIYVSAALYEQPEGSAFKTWRTGQKGDGCILVAPLDRYCPKPLKEVRARVLAHAEAIHALLDAGDGEAMARLKAILAGTAAHDAVPASASTPAA